MRRLPKIKGLIFITLCMLLIASCSPKEYKKLPLDNLDPKLKKTGSLIVKDILSSFTHEDGARILLGKDYMTPLVHGRIQGNYEMYKDSYRMATMAIGEVNSFSLFQVLDKGLVKTMRYKLESSSTNLKFIELKIDVNISYGLADYYLYLTSKDGFLKRENVLPRAVK